MTQREKTPQEIKRDLYSLSDTDIRMVLEVLKMAESQAAELSMIQRGRDIHLGIKSAIGHLEDTREYLENYSITTEDTGEVIPIG